MSTFFLFLRLLDGGADIIFQRSDDDCDDGRSQIKSTKTVSAGEKVRAKEEAVGQPLCKSQAADVPPAP